MVLRQGKVYIQNRFGGWIRETDEGYEFAYDEAYRAGAEARAVSLTLPLSEEIYRDNTLFPFFDGLIPEGWLLDIVSRNWKIDREDRFGLLLHVCRDCIGDVFVTEDEPNGEEDGE